MGLGWNGSTFSWAPAGGGGGDQTPLRGLQFQDSPAEIDIAGSADTTKIYRVGRSIQSLTAELEGVFSVSAVGEKGTSVVDLSDNGAHGSFANAVITRLSIQGRRDGDVTSSITIRPCPE